VFDAIRNAVVLGVLALCVSLTLGSKRRAIWAIALTILTLGAAMGLGVLGLSSFKLMTVPWSSIARLFAWSVLAALVFAVGGVRGLGSPVSGAFMGGLAFGGLASGLSLAHHHNEPNAKARIVLAASAAAVAGPLGTECALLFDTQMDFLSAVGLALLLAIIGAWPAGMTAKMERVGDPLALVLALAVFVAAWFFPDIALAVAAIGLLVIAAAKRALDERAAVKTTPPERAGRFTWWVCVVVVMLLLTPAGVLGFTLEGLPEMQRYVGRWSPELVGGVALLWGALGSALPLALFGEQLLQLDPTAFNDEVWRVVIAASAVGTGGIALILCGKETVRAGWRRWLLQILVLVAAVNRGWFA